MTESTAATTLPPVVKTITVGRSVAAAFELFTDGMAAWWPLAQHSLGQADAKGCGIEGRVGGVLWEETNDGTRHVWGTVLAWEPPGRLVFTWHPGREESLAQQVELTFAADGDGTRVELVHTGWEVLGPAAVATREGYDTGWDFVLGECYSGAAQAG